MEKILVFFLCSFFHVPGIMLRFVARVFFFPPFCFAHICPNADGRRWFKACVMHFYDTQKRRCDVVLKFLVAVPRYKMFCATALAVSRRPGNLDAWVQSQAGPCGICGVKTRNGAVFSPSSSIVSCRIITRMNLINWFIFQRRCIDYNVYFTASSNKAFQNTCIFWYMKDLTVR